MASRLVTCFLLVGIAVVPLIWAQQTVNLYEVEAPAVLSYNSPLRHPDSLRSRPYFDFLSTLYRRDVTKNELFRPYLRAHREIPDLSVSRAKRAIVFRPLFVYRQQEIQRQQLREQRRV